MKNVYKLLIVAGLLSVSSMAGAAATYAGFEFSANVALTSDYVFRGISQTDEDIAIQGGFDVNHETGFYAGLWGSNLEFGENPAVDGMGDGADIELDLYAGFSHEIPFINTGTEFDVGFLHYGYPGAGERRNYDYDEWYGSVSHDFDFAAASVGLNYSDDYFAASGDATYVYVDVDVPLKFIPTPIEIALNLHWGNQNISKNVTFGTPDYNDYKVGVSTDIEGFGLALDFIDTDLSKGQCFGGSNLCEDRVVFTVSKSL